MATPTVIQITPVTLTELTIIVESTNGIEVKTLADCTVTAKAITLSLATGSYNLRFYSQGYNVGILENASGLGDNQIKLTPTSDYIKTSDGTNNYYVKDNYSRQFGNDLLDIVMTKADSSDIPTAISDLTDDTNTNPIDKAESVVDQNNTTNALKYWTGTKAQYDAIATKDANTLYNVEGVGLYKGTTLISNDGANIDLSNLSSTGESKFQTPLISGTNIKTINNTSLLGNGNIDTREIYTAVFDESTFTDVQNAYNSGKIIKCDFLGSTGFVTCYLVFYEGDYFVFMGESRYREVDNIQYIFLRLDSNDNWIYWQKENADTTLSNVSSINSNSAVATALDGKVSKSGDTMTGDLTLYNAQYITKNDAIDTTTTPSSTVGYDPIAFQDANGIYTGGISVKRYSNGGHASTLYSNADGVNAWASIEVGFDSNNTAYCNFPDTECVDSRIYNTAKTLLDNGNLSVAEHSYSLSSYLPNDGQVYEIFLEIRGRTSTASGNYALISANGGTTACNLVYTTTRSSNFTTFCGYGSVYVNSARNLKINLSGNVITNTTIAIRGYRRIGTNN